MHVKTKKIRPSGIKADFFFNNAKWKKTSFENNLIFFYKKNDETGILFLSNKM